MYQTMDFADQISNAIESGMTAGLILIIIIFAISLAIFALYVAVATYVVKKVWFSNIGGSPWRYR